MSPPQLGYVRGRCHRDSKCFSGDASRAPCERAGYLIETRNIGAWFMIVKKVFHVRQMGVLCG